jgi:hypothetical protein
MVLLACGAAFTPHGDWGLVCSASKIFNTEATGRATEGH